MLNIYDGVKENTNTIKKRFDREFCRGNISAEELEQLKKHCVAIRKLAKHCVEKSGGETDAE